MILSVESPGKQPPGWFTKLHRPRLSILIFHRVHAETDLLAPNEPDAIRFDRMMRFLARVFRVLTLGEAAEHMAMESLPARALAISFDDGYADNFKLALPILQRHGLRATFFVSSGFIDGGRMWNDSIAECIRNCRKAAIDLAELGLGRYACESVSDRRRVIGDLRRKLKYQSLSEREHKVRRLQRLCAVDSLPHDLMMSSQQIRALHHEGMEIGGHTVNHPILTTLTDEEAEHEIVRGNRDLQSIIGSPPTVFAYPNGKPGTDYDHRHVAMMRRLGFRAAVSTAPGVARSGDDLYQLPRFTPWESSLPVWAAKLVLARGRTSFATASPEQ